MSLDQDLTASEFKKRGDTRVLSQRARRRDFAVLFLILLGILMVLLISGSLELSEVFTAFLIFVFAATAYYLSTETEARRRPGAGSLSAHEAADEDADDRRGAVNLNDLQSVIEAYPEPALLVGMEGRVYVTNDLAAEVFRLPRTGLRLGSSIIRRPDVLKELDRISRGLGPEGIEIEIAGTPDQVFRVIMKRVVISGEARVLIALVELTELRRAEKARADFLANASHELRTPLTSLAGFIETMRGPARDDKDAWDRFLEIMYGQTERMRRLIHDLLSLSRIELNEHRRPDQKVDLVRVVSENVEALVPVARERSLGLELISSTADAEVLGVRDELVQVVQNLIDNAMKYTTPESNVLVEISSDLDLEQARVFAGRRWPNAARISILQSRSEPTDRFVVLRVSDQGEGINREHLPRLGERFYRVDEGRDRSVGGTGLGLAIVKHIVARHRGGLMVESEAGRGSAFGIWLPVISNTLAPAVPGGDDHGRA